MGCWQPAAVGAGHRKPMKTSCFLARGAVSTLLIALNMLKHWRVRDRSYMFVYSMTCGQALRGLPLATMASKSPLGAFAPCNFLAADMRSTCKAKRIAMPSIVDYGSLWLHSRL